MAINKVRRRGAEAHPNLFEEIADVEIMCGQMREYFGDKKIDERKKEKLRRLEERLK